MQRSLCEEVRGLLINNTVRNFEWPKSIILHSFDTFAIHYNLQPFIYTQTQIQVVNTTIQKNREKIYERLHYQAQPANYYSEIPWAVQQQISATNGIHYIDRIGKLKRYPIYEVP